MLTAMKFTPSSAFMIGFFIMLQVVYLSSSFFSKSNTPISLFTFMDGFKNNTQYGYIYCFAYGFVPLFGGLFGVNIARKWGMFKSSMGKAVFFLSISLICWSIGAYTWAYYNFVVHASVPYPGLSDVAWISSIPLWAIGVFFLGQATFIKFALRKAGGKLFAIVVPLLVIASSCNQRIKFITNFKEVFAVLGLWELGEGYFSQPLCKFQ